MVDFFNVWDIVVGVLSLGSTFLIAYIYHQLPSKKVDVLLALLHKTSGLLSSCVEKGLLEAPDITGFEEQLSTLRDQIERLQLEVTRAKTWTEDVANMINGLTRRINAMCHSLHEVGAAISDTSLRGRERLEAESRASCANSGNDSDQSTASTISEPVLGVTPSLDSPGGELPEAAAVASDAASSHTPSSHIDNAGADTSTPPPVVFQPQAISRPPLESPCANSHPPSSRHPTPQPPPPQYTSTQDSCSESPAITQGIIPALPGNGSKPTSRPRVLAQFVRQACKRHSVQSQHSDLVYLLELPSIKMVDEPDEEREDHHDSYHA